jgi:hypothetical protein
MLDPWEGESHLCQHVLVVTSPLLPALIAVRMRMEGTGGEGSGDVVGVLCGCNLYYFEQ